VAFIKIIIYNNNALIAFLSPTERLIYYQLEFSLLCFASEFKSLVQFFQRTSNICLKKVYLCILHRQTNKKISIKTESSGEFFWKLFPDGKGEERAASADCKLGGFKHKIFKWHDRIVK
jgi:hypothetical protein